MAKLEREERIYLRDFMRERFSMIELRTLCFDLHVSHEEFRQDSLSEFVQELIRHFERQKNLGLLVTEVEKLRNDGKLQHFVKKLGPIILRTKVEIRLDVNEWSQKQLIKLKDSITKILKLGKEDVSVLGLESGSVRVLFGMPVAAADRLFAMDLRQINKLPIKEITAFSQMSEAMQHEWRIVSLALPRTVSLGLLATLSANVLAVAILSAVLISGTFLITNAAKASSCEPSGKNAVVPVIIPTNTVSPNPALTATATLALPTAAPSMSVPAINAIVTDTTAVPTNIVLVTDTTVVTTTALISPPTLYTPTPTANPTISTIAPPPPTTSAPTATSKPVSISTATPTTPVIVTSAPPLTTTAIVTATTPSLVISAAFSSPISGSVLYPSSDSRISFVVQGSVDHIVITATYLIDPLHDTKTASIPVKTVTSQTQWSVSWNPYAANILPQNSVSLSAVACPDANDDLNCVTVQMAPSNLVVLAPVVKFISPTQNGEYNLVIPIWTYLSYANNSNVSRVNALIYDDSGKQIDRVKLTYSMATGTWDNKAQLLPGKYTIGGEVCFSQGQDYCYATDPTQAFVIYAIATPTVSATTATVTNAPPAPTPTP